MGDKTADAIVERFGVTALDILDRQPERLLEVKGITESKLEAIKESYTQSRSLRNLMTFLAPFKVTPKTALRIQQFFGAESLSIVRKSPFELCRISGFGFKQVDDIARKTSRQPNDPMRIRGALFYILDESRNRDGHLFLIEEELCSQALSLLNEKLPVPQMRLQARDVSEELYNIVIQGELISDSGALYLPRSFETEDSVARSVAEMLSESTAGVRI
ncbi:MAG: helix-hairpin-helix domain-containing protein [Ruminiclostridium sp.]